LLGLFVLFVWLFRRLVTRSDVSVSSTVVSRPARQPESRVVNAWSTVMSVPVSSSDIAVGRSSFRLLLVVVAVAGCLVFACCSFVWFGWFAGYWLPFACFGWVCCLLPVVVASVRSSVQLVAGRPFYVITNSSLSSHCCCCCCCLLLLLFVVYVVMKELPETLCIV
jgi:hypothetical protein